MRILALLLCSSACDHLDGLGGPSQPLATFSVEITGAAPPDADLQVALVWGMQWLPEPLCILPAENADAAVVIGSVSAPGPGCRDPFGFVPIRVEINAPVTPGATSTLDLVEVPGADVLVGDLDARVAYASFVVYDDRDGDGTLSLAKPRAIDDSAGSDTVSASTDVVYGGSFVSMIHPDVRLGYREGAFDETAAFYPRVGCADPPLGFSVLAASGFTADEGGAATLAGTLPREDDVAQCSASAPTGTVVPISIQPPASVSELRCTANSSDSTVTYIEPPSDAPDFAGRQQACVHLPTFGSGAGSTATELVVTGVVGAVDDAHPIDACIGLTHYILKGCANDPDCTVVSWDLGATPPAWWPCEP
jgi:hypothetical protein